MTGCRNARCAMDVEAHVAVSAGAGLAGVQAHADPNWTVVRPPMAGEGALTVHGRRNRLRGAGKSDEERIPLGPDLDTSTERVAQQGVVSLQDLAVQSWPQLLHSRVDPSMSVNRNVTVPCGRMAIQAPSLSARRRRPVRRR